MNKQTDRTITVSLAAHVRQGITVHKQAFIVGGRINYQIAKFYFEVILAITHCQHNFTFVLVVTM